MRKYILCCLLVLSMLLCPACGEGEISILDSFEQEDEVNQGQVTYLLLAHSEAEGSQTDKAAAVFRETLEEVSGGTMSVDIYPSITLSGSSLGIIMQNGVDIGICGGPDSLLRIASWLPVLSGVDREELAAALEPGGVLRGELEQECAEANMRLMGILPIQIRFLAGKYPLREKADMEGKSMRVISGLSSDEQIWGGFGVETVPLNVGQLYLALQQDMVDVNMTTLEIFMDYRLYEQEKYLLCSDHELYTRIMLVSEDFYASLSPEQQEYLDQATQQMMSWLQNQQEIYEADSFAFLQQQGVTVIEPAPEHRQEILSTMYDPVWQHLVDSYGQETVEQVLELFP